MNQLIKVISLIMFALLLTSKAFAGGGASEPIICFTEKTAGKMVVELEKCRITNKQVENLVKENQELEKQIEYLKTIIELQKKELEISKQTIENLQTIIDYQNKAYKNVYRKTFFDKVKENNLFLTIGILIGVAITL